MKFKIILIFGFLIHHVIYSQDQTILREFKNPGRENSIVPLWSWNGTLKAEEVKRQIDLMIAKGVYGAFFACPGRN